MKMKMKKQLKMLLSMITIILFPGIFLYSHNVSVAAFPEIIPATVKYALIALVIWLCMLAVFRDSAKACLECAIIMLVLMNFNTIHDAISQIPMLASKKFFLLIFCIIFVVLGIVIQKKGIASEKIVQFIGVLFGGLILFNIVLAIPAMVTRWNTQPSKTPDYALAEQSFEGNTKPNVYYMIFDEYAGFDNIERYYGYDNAQFYNDLTELHVNVSRESYNKEAICTYAIIPNLLNLDYVASEKMDEIDCWKLTKNPALYQLFWNNGYQVNMINHMWTLDTTGCNVLNENVDAQTLSDYLESNGILAEINQLINQIQMKLYGTSSTQYNAVLKNTLDLMEHSVDYVGDDTPTFTMVYMCCPHALFVLDENGEFNDSSLYNEFRNPEPYVNQLKYTNTCIEQTIANIQEKDPDALIIVQSDHGGRYPHQLAEEYGQPYDADTETIYMQNILNCVYYKEQTMEIEGLSGINTLRYALNYVFGTDFQMLQEPEGYRAWTGIGGTK